MKVLWVSLVKFPPLCEHLGEAVPAHCGWMYSSAKAMLKEMPEVRLGVMVYSYGRNYERYDIEGVTYYLIPTAKIDRTSKKQIEACSKIGLALFVDELSANTKGYELLYRASKFGG